MSNASWTVFCVTNFSCCINFYKKQNDKKCTLQKHISITHKTKIGIIFSSIKTRNEEHTQTQSDYLRNHSSCLLDRFLQDLLHFRVRLFAISTTWNMEIVCGYIPFETGEQLMLPLQVHSRQQKFWLSQFLVYFAHSISNNHTFAWGLSTVV